VARGFSETPVSIASAVLEGGSGICRLVDGFGWVEVPATKQALARILALRQRVFSDGPRGTVGGGPPTHGVVPVVGCAAVNGPETVVSPVTVRSKGPGDSLWERSQVALPPSLPCESTDWVGVPEILAPSFAGD